MSVNKANQISGALKEEDQFQHQLLPFTIATDEAPSSFHTSNLFNSSNTVQETTTIELSETSEQHHQHPCDLLSLQAKKYSDIIILNDHSSETISNAPIKWMSSKMRLMRKMMAQEPITMNKPRGKIECLLNTQTKSENITPSGAVIRVCSVCNTTKTPLWRSGPQGPKSLCNACGIRQMKARRAAATSTIQNKDMIIKNEKKFNVDRTIPYKKRYKFSNYDVNHEKLKFDESPFGLRESSSTIFHPSFPQDEKDAALLLMTLSFG